MQTQFRDYSNTASNVLYENTTHSQHFFNQSISVVNTGSAGSTEVSHGKNCRFWNKIFIQSEGFLSRRPINLATDNSSFYASNNKNMDLFHWLIISYCISTIAVVYIRWSYRFLNNSNLKNQTKSFSCFHRCMYNNCISTYRTNNYNVSQSNAPFLFFFE